MTQSLLKTQQIRRTLLLVQQLVALRRVALRFATQIHQFYQVYHSSFALVSRGAPFSVWRRWQK